LEANTERLKVSLVLGLAGAAIALAGGAVSPPRAIAQYATFVNGVLTVHSSEGTVVPRCAADGELTVSGAIPEPNGANCKDLRRIEADSIASANFDFSNLPDDLGGGQGPITIHAKSLVTDPTDFSDDKFTGAPGHINIFEAGIGFDSMTGGNLNDVLDGGADSDKIDGGGGNDTIRGGSGGDKLIGGLGADSLFGGGGGDKLLGGPGRDLLKGGGGNDKLVGGPGKDQEKQ
jgi:Ca2+-binding RTX toxin-like protein